MHAYQDNPETLSKTKINKNTPSGYSLFTNCSFDSAKNKLDCSRGKDCMEKLCKILKEHATKLIICEKKEIIPLTHEEKKSYEKQKVCHIYKKGFSTDDDNEIARNKKYHKVRYHCHYTRKGREAADSICNLRCKTPKEIPVVFHNGSTYDYQFIIKQLARESDRKIYYFFSTY